MQLRLQFGSALGLGVGLILATAIFSGILAPASLRLSDFLYQSIPPTNCVVLIAIDDASLREIGKLPWPPAAGLALLDAIQQTQPRIVGFSFPLAELAGDNAALLQNVQRTPNIIQSVNINPPLLSSSQTNSLAWFNNFVSLPSDLQTGDPTLAHTFILPDADNIVRRIPIALTIQGQPYRALGILAAELYQQQALTDQPENRQVQLGSLSWPVEDQGQMKINFVNPGQQQIISAVDVLSGRIDKTILRDKIVLVGIMGSTASSYRTPLASNQGISALEIQADIVETILGGHGLASQDRLSQIIMIFLLALLAGATLPHFRFLSALGLTLLYVVFYLSYAFTRFSDNILVEPLYPSLALSLVLIGSTTFRYFSEERQREFVERLFRRYMPPEAVAQVTTDFNEGALPLNGAVRQIAALYVDLRDLDLLIETVEPTELIRLLNDYIVIVVGIIFRFGGTITKQTGDAVLAGWNLLIDQPDYARQAILAAIEIKHELADCAKQQPKEMQIKVGIGVSTGRVVAGRIGASSRAEYTIIGEIVNIAQRLAVKAERGIFIDDATLSKVGDEFQTREVKSLQLRRKTDPKQVWQLIEATELQDEITSEQSETNEVENKSQP